MKKIKLVVLIFIAIACSPKKEETQSWKELDAFHEIMAKAFHPLKDSGNIAPAKLLITDLAGQAAAWSSASLPEKVNTPEMKSMLSDLKTQSQTLSDSVKKGASDDYVKTGIQNMHSQFHKIMETWTEKGEHHMGEGEHHHDNDGDEDEDEDGDDD